MPSSCTCLARCPMCELAAPSTRTPSLCVLANDEIIREFASETRKAPLVLGPPTISKPPGRVVTAKRPDHVWHIDLTVVPTGAGMWCAWLPFALPQRWPFCWWVLVALDHFSRRVMGVAVFANRPDCRAVCSSLGQTLRRVGATPKYIVCDRDSGLRLRRVPAVGKTQRHPPAAIRCRRSPR